MRADPARGLPAAPEQSVPRAAEDQILKTEWRRKISAGGLWACSTGNGDGSSPPVAKDGASKRETSIGTLSEESIRRASVDTRDTGALAGLKLQQLIPADAAGPGGGSWRQRHFADELAAWGHARLDETMGATRATVSTAAAHLDALSLEPITRCSFASVVPKGKNFTVERAGHSCRSAACRGCNLWPAGGSPQGAGGPPAIQEQDRMAKSLHGITSASENLALGG